MAFKMAYIFKKNGKYGLRNRGDEILPAVYLAIASGLNEGIFIAVDENLKVCAFRSNGNQIVDYKCDEALKINNKEGTFVISKDLKAVYATQYDVTMVSSKLFYTSTYGERSKTSVFKLNEEKDKWEVVINDVLSHNVKVDNEVIIARIPSLETWIITDKSVKNFKCSMKFEKIVRSVQNCQIQFFQYDETGVYDLINNKELFRVKCADRKCWNVYLNSETDEIVWINSNNQYCFINEKQYTLWESENCHIEGILNSSNFRLFSPLFSPKTNTNILKLRSNDKYRLVNLDNEKRTDVYDNIEQLKLNNGKIVFKVHNNAKIGIIDKNFDFIFPVEYDIIFYVDANNTFTIGKNNKYGRANSDGVIVSPIIWDKISRCDENNYEYIQVKLNNKIGAINPEGKVICEPIWDESYGGIHPNNIILSRNVDDGENQKKIISIINFDDGIIFEEELDSIERIAEYYVKTIKGNLTGVYNVKERKYELEPCICCVFEKNDIIYINTLTESREIRL